MIFDWILNDSQQMDHLILWKPVEGCVKICLLQLSTPVKLFQRYVGKILDSIVSKATLLSICNKRLEVQLIFTVYLDIGRVASDSATLAFTFAGTFSRYWDIKITQIPCDVNYE